MSLVYGQGRVRSGPRRRPTNTRPTTGFADVDDGYMCTGLDLAAGILPRSDWVKWPVDQSPFIYSVVDERKRMEPIAIIERHAPPAAAAADDGIRDLVSRMPTDLWHEIQSRVSAILDRFSSSKPDLDLWGPPPTDVDVLRAVIWGFERDRDAKATAVLDSISLDDATRLLRADASDLNGAIRKGQLVGIRLGEQWRLPRWQFSDEWEPLRGIDQLIRTYPGDAAALTAWVSEPNLILDERTPLEMLRAGDVEPVIVAAKALAAVP